MESTGPRCIRGQGEELCCTTYQQPDAQGEKSPALRRQTKRRNVLQINAVKICQSISAVFKSALWNVQQRTSSWWSKKKNDMNAKLSNIVDGKSMTCMQLFNSSSATTVRDNAWTEISTEPEKMKDRRKVLTVEEDGSRHTTHANIVYN